MAFLAALIPALGGAGAAAGTAGAATAAGASAVAATAGATTAASLGSAAAAGLTAGTGITAGSSMAALGAATAAALPTTAALAGGVTAGAAGAATAAGAGMSLLAKAGLATTLISGYSSSKAATDSARIQSKLLKQQGKDEMMAAGMQAKEERRQSRYLSSRARAVAAASGADALDPTAVNTIAGIEAEGEYRALTALFNGRTRSNTLGMQAGITRDEGRALSKAAWMKAGTTMLNANYGPDWLAKYG